MNISLPVIYLFVCLMIGVSSLSQITIQTIKGNAFARAFIGLYTTLSLQVFALMMVSLTKQGQLGPYWLHQLFVYLDSFVAHYGVMVFLPYFLHRFVGKTQLTIERGLYTFVAVIFISQHISEFLMPPFWDHMGDYLEDAAFVLVIGYCLVLMWVNRGANIHLSKILRWCFIGVFTFGLVTSLYDLFIAEDFGFRLYPLSYSFISLLVVWFISLEQITEPQQGITYDKKTLDEQPTSIAPQIWQLSAREQQVFELIGEGLSNKAIGSALYISSNTVKTHITAIFDKSSIRSKIGLIALQKH